MRLQINGGNLKVTNPLRYFLYAGFALLVISTLGCIRHSNLNTVSKIEMEKHLGLWHQVALIPNFFQADCASNTLAEYTQIDDNSLEILNSCLANTGERISAKGIGLATGNPPDFTKIKVSFAPKWLSWLPFVWGDYWIISIEPKYNSVLVGSPNRKYLWILSRKHFIKKTTFDHYLEVASDNGFDTSLLVYDLSTLR